MKHTKSMVLIPEDALHRYEQRQRLDTSPITSNMMQKDTDMSNVLQRSDMDDDEKQKLYHANLERCLFLHTISKFSEDVRKIVVQIEDC